MSGSTATITFKLDGDVKTFQILAKDAESLKKVLGTSASEAKKLSQQLLDMNQAVEAFRGMETLIRGIESAFGSLSAEFNAASANETRLAQSMKTAMGATQEQVDAIISLTDAQEELGVVDGQFQISAAQRPVCKSVATRDGGGLQIHRNCKSSATRSGRHHKAGINVVGEFCPPPLVPRPTMPGAVHCRC